MTIRRVKVNGRKVWQARVAYKGLRKSTLRETKEEAREAEAALVQELKAQAGRAAEQALAPATLRQLFEAYVEDLDTRGKDEETVARAAQTARVVEALVPELLNKPVTRITEADIFAFRRARLSQPCFTPRPKDPERAPERWSIWSRERSCSPAPRRAPGL
jgi:hypothetical protein